MGECVLCAKFRPRLENIVAATRRCLKEFRSDRDTTGAYGELRREGERIDRMLQRVRNGRLPMGEPQTYRCMLCVHGDWYTGCMKERGGGIVVRMSRPWPCPWFKAKKKEPTNG